MNSVNAALTEWSGAGPSPTAPAQCFRFTFGSPWIYGTDREDAPLDALLIPMKVNLGLLTVAGLCDELMTRIERRYCAIDFYPSRLLLSRADHTLLPAPGARTAADVDLPDPAEVTALCEQLGLPSAARAKALLQSQRWEAPHNAAADLWSAVPQYDSFIDPDAFTRPLANSVLIDAVMNAEDTLDCFIPQPLHALRDEIQGTVYDVVVTWDAAVPAALDAPAAITEGSVGTNQIAVLEQRRLSDRRSLVPASQLQPTVASLPSTQRSTYVDLLRHRRRLDRGRLAVRQRALMEELSTCSSSSEDDEPSVDPAVGISPTRGSLSAVKRAGRAALFEERVALEAREQSARELLVAVEAGEFATPVALYEDSVRHVLTLRALQGDFTQNGRLSALLRKYRLYPVDTLPLVAATPAEDRERLSVNADNTALLGFRFVDEENAERLKKRNAAAAREAQTRALVGQRSAKQDDLARITDPAGNPRSFRTVLAEAIEHERGMQDREDRERHRVLYYRERGEPVPPREPTPPPPPAVPSRPATQHIEGIPAAVLQAAFDSYLNGRHDIVRLERIFFREATRAMGSILSKQQMIDALAEPTAGQNLFHVSDTVLGVDLYALNAVGPRPTVR